MTSNEITQVTDQLSHNLATLLNIYRLKSSLSKPKSGALEPDFSMKARLS